MTDSSRPFPFSSEIASSFIVLQYPPETQLWSLCLCSGYYILVYFSETSHVTVLSLDVLYTAHSGLFREMFGSFTITSPRSLKMAKINLVKHFGNTLF